MGSLDLLTFLDPPRHDTKETIHRGVSYGVEVKMTTGDYLRIAIETARIVELGPKIPGREGVMPHAGPGYQKGPARPQGEVRRLHPQRRWVRAGISGAQILYLTVSLRAEIQDRYGLNTRRS